MTSLSKRTHKPGSWSEQVKRLCELQGLQLTPLRQRVLSILSGGQGPLGAYAIIERLSKMEGKQIAPPTVYRTLDFFVEHGFVHKVESRNVFAPCEHVGHLHEGVLLLCERCGRSEEVEDAALVRALRKIADSVGFRLMRQMIELQGLCKACAEKA